MYRKRRRRLMWFLGGTFLAIGAVAALLFGYNRFSLMLIPQGETEIRLDYGEAFSDPGVKPLFRGSRIWKEGFSPDTEVHREGNVDTGKTGTYHVRYFSDFLFWHGEAERTVHVVDRKPPEILLENGPDAYVLPGREYEEAGFTAFDGYDGDLTDRVQRREEDGKVIYSVTDTAGNRTEVVRTIHYDDPEAPVITLEGESALEIYTGTPFQDPGYTAIDNCDGDITENVTVEGEVNPYRSGEYTLTYKVSDSFGNVTSVIRTVTVVPKPQPEKVDPEGKVIYLTFDDGPGPYTRQLLEVLEEYNVKATFFVVSGKYDYVIGEIAQAGHSIGIHTATHDYSAIYASEDAYFADIYLMQAIILEQTGEETTLMRFPGGSSNTVSRFNQGIMTRLTQAVTEAGFQYFDWNVDSNDAGGARSSQEVFENVVNGIGDREISIVLQHDTKQFSVEAVEEIIVWGLENGYVFLPLEPESPTSHHRINN